jgi:hypothetical protein
MPSTSGPSRPFFNYSIVQLAQLFQEAKHSRERLGQILCELNHRKTPKAVEMRAAVEDAISRLATPTTSAASIPPDQRHPIKPQSGAPAGKPFPTPAKKSPPSVAGSDRRSAPSGVPDSFFPLQHISIRVPWHDSGWNGTVCAAPKFNTACLKLKSIADSKDEAGEESVRGQSIEALIARGAGLPPCFRERGTFMADFEFERTREHPYADRNAATHGHFRPTPLRFPGYSAAGLPFRWMMKNAVFGDPKKGLAGLIDQYPLEEVDQQFEPQLSFETNWVQDHRNHRALLNCFWSHVRPEESLVFFYAKQVPLVEDTGRRILLGVGRVKSIGGLTEYAYEGLPDGRLRSLLWECMVSHSIRPAFEDGFLLPYYEALRKSDEDPEFDPAQVVAFAPDDRFTEFSYATEHVGNDAAISALLAMREALQRSSEGFGYRSEPHEQWIDRELGRLWKKRGPFPGMGAVLCATGATMGNFIAQAVTDKAGENGNPWRTWFALLDDPGSVLPPELARHIDSTLAKSWKRMAPARRTFLELLSGMDLTQDQAQTLVTPEGREEADIDLTDEQIIANPYRVYEATRLLLDSVSVGVVDRGMFPTAMIRKNFPVEAPSEIKTAVDARRLRALTIRNLETAAVNGDTLRPREYVIRDLRGRPENDDEQGAQVTADLLAVAEEELFEGEIRIVRMADERAAYQLERLARAGDLIRRTIQKRREAERQVLDIPWRAALDKFLESDNAPQPNDPEERQREEIARQEKTAALTELAAARFSVLIGRAGTGKTTLLSVLCTQPQISRDGVVLLAPTGKARVRMEDVARRAGIANCHAYTLAQFLTRSKRYDPMTQRYMMIDDKGEKVGRTVIVDECSMLTEEMMAALLESLSGVDRLIFVGDYRQLPPIGAGRPFIDIVAQMRPDQFEAGKPRVALGYAELMIPRRQAAGERDDLLLASWFGGGETSAGDDQVFEILSGKRKSKTVRFLSWETPDELERLLPLVLRETLGFDPAHEDWKAFALSLGGSEFNGSVWFHPKREDQAGAGIAAEAWQILSPVRQKPWGVDSLNRFVHLKYKGPQLDQARKPGMYRSIPSPKGDQQIIYGDKVINNRNWRVPNRRLYPGTDESGYLANGEIGVVVGQRKTKKFTWTPKHLEIEFSTQRGKKFTFYAGDFKEDGDANLELAYALTVHKAQGSEFETVFLVLPRSPLMVTRELLYTALTRQRGKVVVLLQGSATDLHRLSSERYSAAACRLTNLFGPPKPVEIKEKFLEERLIHNTTRGELVRSKSEVIIANLLHNRKIDYEYEQEIVIDGAPAHKYPDFTIEDDDAGVTYYWEHLGLLGDSGYKRRWAEKEEWYRANGILPRNEGRGPRGTLIVTRDDSRGGIDSSQINRLIDELFGP